MFIAQPNSSPHANATIASPTAAPADRPQQRAGQAGRAPERHLGRRPGALTEEAVRQQARDRAHREPGPRAERRAGDDADHRDRLHRRGWATGRRAPPPRRRRASPPARAPSPRPRRARAATRPSPSSTSSTSTAVTAGLTATAAGTAAGTGDGAPSRMTRARSPACRAKAASWVAMSTAAPVGGHRSQQGREGGLARRVHPARGLVEGHHAGPGGQDRGHRDALALPHREVERVAGGEVRRCRGPRARAPPAPGARRARAAAPAGPAPTSSSTRSVSRWRPGSWPTKPRAGKRRSAGRPVTSSPSSSTRPAAAGCRPASTRSRVLLPLPFGPWSVVTSPARSSSRASRTTVRPGWPAVTPSSACAHRPRGAGSRRRSGIGGRLRAGEPPGADGEHPVGRGADAVGAVLGDDHGRAPVGQGAQRRHQGRGRRVVELGGGLVEQQQARRGREDARDRHPLPLAPRERRRSRGRSGGRPRRRRAPRPPSRG